MSAKDDVESRPVITPDQVIHGLVHVLLYALGTVAAFVVATSSNRFGSEVGLLGEDPAVAVPYWSAFVVVLPVGLLLVFAFLARLDASPTGRGPVGAWCSFAAVLPFGWLGMWAALAILIAGPVPGDPSGRPTFPTWLGYSFVLPGLAYFAHATWRHVTEELFDRARRRALGYWLGGAVPTTVLVVVAQIVRWDPPVQ